MIQHAVQPTLRCPLCQDTLRSVALMRSHLTHLHSVTADCTQKLINAVRHSDTVSHGQIQIYMYHKNIELTDDLLFVTS